MKTTTPTALTNELYLYLGWKENARTRVEGAGQIRTVGERNAFQRLSSRALAAVSF